jgi:hypothetical protein
MTIQTEQTPIAGQVARVASLYAARKPAIVASWMLMVVPWAQDAVETTRRIAPNAPGIAVMPDDER